jgi:hypothetical protein
VIIPSVEFEKKSLSEPDGIESVDSEMERSIAIPVLRELEPIKNKGSGKYTYSEELVSMFTADEMSGIK